MLGSYFLNKTATISKKSTNKNAKDIFLGLELSSPSLDSKNGKIRAPTKGSSTIADSLLEVLDQHYARTRNIKTHRDPNLQKWVHPSVIHGK